MSFKILDTIFYRVILLFIFSFAGITSSFAQYSIDGDTQVYLNDLKMYTVVDQNGQTPSGQYNSYFTWNTTIGNMQAPSGNGMHTMPIHFNALGSGNITVGWTDSFTFQQYYIQTSVQVTTVPPSTPSAPTIQSNNCNSTTLKHGTPPTGVTWYWQSTAAGESISDSNPTKTVTNGTTYYLRAKNNTTNVWSTNSSSVDYTIYSAPIWYTDVDNDGFGDPNSTPISSCTQPVGQYVSNNFDECPTQAGNPLNNGCPGAGDPGSTDKNYVHTITPLIAVSDVSQITNDDDKLESVTYFDGLGRAIQSVGIRAGGQKQDIKAPVIYDEFGRQSKTYLAHATVTSSVSIYTSNTTLINDLNTYYVSKHASQLNSGNPNTYSETRFDNSPLSRALESGTPGEDWLINPNSDNDHTTKYDYNSNVTNEVYKIDYMGAGQPLSIANYYAEGVLLKNTVKNSNWVTADGKVNTKDVFTDKSGKKIAEYSYILESSILKTLKTYYVYDDPGNMVYVLTPKLFTNLGSGTTISVTHLNDLAFQYKYDTYNRQIEQKVPGKKLWEYMVYDQLDRPILTQDENLKDDGKWLFTKYDAFGRAVYSGLFTNSSSRATLQTAVDSYISGNTNNLSNIESRTTSASSIGGVSINYSNNAYPTTGLEVLTVNYYDDYTFTDTNKPTTPTSILDQTVTTRTKGFSTASWTKTLGSSTWSKSYTYYNEKGSVIYVYEKNHLGGYTQNKSRLDFRGKVKASVTEHKKTGSSPPLVIKDYFTYDHVERPLSHTQSIGGDNNVLDDEITFDDQSPTSDETIDHEASVSITLTPGFTAKPGFNASIETFDRELMAYNNYDELGQLTSKKLGGEANQIIANSTGLQTVDYTYDIRGALKAVNDVDNIGSDLFAYELNYETGEGANFSSIDEQFNGNISQMVWKSAHNNTKKSYIYNYDDLNRFTKASYGEGSGLTSNTSFFKAEVTGYDHNGNITGLTRTAASSSLIDNLTYTYDTGNGNQLMKIVDASGTDGFTNGSTGSNEDYDYDDNGNLIKDLNKNISLIDYNHLDLVEKVTFTDGKRIEFDYDAVGTKLQMRYVNGGATTTTDYIGGFQYVGTDLKFFPTPEGYFEVTGTPPSGELEGAYVYTLKDHLGNNRVAFKDFGGDNIVDNTDIVSSTDYYPMGLIHNGEYVANSDYNYKYQGKEKLMANSYNMYDFGSRMYDASVGRWFNTDPQNQFGSPYLAMGNNWVTNVDPNGQFAFTAALVGAIIGATTAAVSYSLNALANDNWSLGGFAGSVLGGALVGGISGGFSSSASTALTADAFGESLVGASFGALAPSVNIPISNNFSLNLSPAFALGSSASGIGANASLNASFGDFSASYGYGVSHFDKAHGTGKRGFESRSSYSASYSSGDFSASLYTTKFNSGGGETSQRVGGLGIKSGDFSIRYENDGAPFGRWSGDGGDSHRTAAVRIGVGDYSAGFNIFTGLRSYEGDPPKGEEWKVTNYIDKYGARHKYGYVNEVGTKHRLGALYFGYRGSRLGVNSEKIKHSVQGVFAHRWLSPQGSFQNTSWDTKPYIQYQSYNPFTLW